MRLRIFVGTLVSLDALKSTAIATLYSLGDRNVWKSFRFSNIFSLLAVVNLILFSGCLPSSTTSPITSPSQAATLAQQAAINTLGPAPGPRAAKFIFKQTSPSGSFDAPSVGGTVAGPGTGHPATRVFNSDGSLLASGTTSSSWPKWITSFEIGISGANNLSALNPDCARFAGAGESASQCRFDGRSSGGVLTPCGASAGLFRVSEYDCLQTTPTDGNGGPSDGIYIRATFSRDSSVLGTAENILAVIEYAASALNPAPQSPVSCFSGGVLTPEACADMAWKIYLKHNATEIVQPFLLLVPPTFAAVNTTANTGGSGVSTRQFYIPLAADGALTVFQLSRIKALTPTPAFNTICSNGVLPANSALCVGMIFYSVTFYRI